MMEQYNLLNNVLNYELLKIIHSSNNVTSEDLKDLFFKSQGYSRDLIGMNKLSGIIDVEVLTSLQSLMTEGLVTASEDGLTLTSKAYQQLEGFSKKLLEKSDELFNFEQFFFKESLYIKLFNGIDSSDALILDLTASSLAYEDVYHMITEDF